MKLYHTETQVDYDALMIELDSQGVVWGFKRDKPTERSFWDVYKENTFLIIEGCSLSYGSLKGKYRERHSEWPLIEYKAKGEIMNEKQFKQLAHDLVMDIASTIGTYTINLEFKDDDLAKTHELINKLGDAITEFIDGRKPKFDVGDYVVEEGEEYLFGKVITLIEVKHEEKFYGNFYIPTSNKFHDYSIGTSEIEPEYCRCATPEEVAKYKAARNFHEHGRKPFDVKEGDMLYYNVNATNQLVRSADNWGNDDFISGRYTLLKTAEELEKWLADGQ